MRSELCTRLFWHDVLQCLRLKEGMNGNIHVARPPSRPLLVYDGNCNFCGLWVRRWRQMTGDSVEYLPSSHPKIGEQFPEIPPDTLDSAVQLIDVDGTVYSAAKAVFRTMAHNRFWQWPLRIYEAFPLFAALSERFYHFVSRNRPKFSLVTRFCYGKHLDQPSYYLVRWIFLRGLGLVYLFAFLSLWMQVGGLVGHSGILPADQFMSAVKQQCDDQGIGIKRFYYLPTLSWFGSSDAFLHGQCASGVVLSVLLIVDIAPAPCLALLWLLFLSLAVVARDFLGFQWDNLLLETGLLAIFFAPLHILPRHSREPPPSHLFIWLLRFLLFKLMFSSGCVKLLSGDPNWRNLTALTFHYQTQPLPPWTAWYANQFPVWFQKFSCAATFAIELGAPFLIFTPRRIRFAGAVLLAWLQILIIITGNYAYFNWLSLVLCLLLLDDFAVDKLVGGKWLPAFPPALRVRKTLFQRWLFPFQIIVAAVILTASVFMLAVTLDSRSSLLTPAGWVAEKLMPFRSVNNYGLFAVMTTQRKEIVVEGSDDGTNWLAYEFKYKPGDINRRPQFIAPFQPRLDWQMWFAALGTYQQNPWFENFCLRLLQGSPEVLGLLANNPFPQHPPKFIRAELYGYHFTTHADQGPSHGWWRRELVGPYMPTVSLRE